MRAKYKRDVEELEKSVKKMYEEARRIQIEGNKCEKEFELQWDELRDMLKVNRKLQEKYEEQMRINVNLKDTNDKLRERIDLKNDKLSKENEKRKEKEMEWIIKTCISWYVSNWEENATITEDYFTKKKIIKEISNKIICLDIDWEIINTAYTTKECDKWVNYVLVQDKKDGKNDKKD